MVSIYLIRLIIICIMFLFIFRISGWIKAHAHMFNHNEYPLAISTLKQLDDHSPLCNSNRLLVAIGKSYYFNGDRKNALIYLQRVRYLQLFFKIINIYLNKMFLGLQIKSPYARWFVYISHVFIHGFTHQRFRKITSNNLYR